MERNGLFLLRSDLTEGLVVVFSEDRVGEGFVGGGYLVDCVGVDLGRGVGGGVRLGRRRNVGV